MREIKFRVWDWKEKKYSDDEVLIDAISGVPHIRMIIKNKPVLAFTSNYVLEQYTGLKDKNGVEIYEGDIIKGDAWRKESVVVFGKIGYDGQQNGLTGFALKCNECDYGDMFYELQYNQNYKEFEVIGNIHKGETE